MGSVEFDIANAMIEGVENNFKGKSDAEIKEAATNAINTMMMSFMMAGDNGVQMLILTLSSCIKITCGATASDKKKAAIADLFEGPIGNLISEQGELFFDEADEDTFGAINAAASQLKMGGCSRGFGACLSRSFCCLRRGFCSFYSRLRCLLRRLNAFLSRLDGTFCRLSSCLSC